MSVGHNMKLFFLPITALTRAMLNLIFLVGIRSPKNI